MAIGNGKCNFKRKITENHFSAGKNNKIHKIYKISQTKWIYFHATLLRIRVYINNTHLYVNGISNMYNLYGKTEFPFFHHIQKRKRQFFENENQCPYIINVPRPFLVCPFLFQPCNQQALGAFNNQWSISRSITMYTSNVLSFATHSAVYERFHLRWFVSCEVFREIDPWPYSKWSTGREHVDGRSQHGTVSSLKYAIWSLEHDTDAV